MTRVLLVDDDPRISGFVTRGLSAEGYVVDLAESGSAALRRGLDDDYPLIILDLGLPDVDGLEVCRQLRRAGKQGCILVLTARDDLRDKVEGLRNGADDYLTKPFAFEELLARLEALLRRSSPGEPPALLEAAGLTIDTVSHTVRRGEDPVALTAKEYALLDCLMRNAGAVVSRSRLLREVWGLSFDPGTKIVDVYVRYLRQKIDRPGEPSPIQTLRGVGYRLDDP